MGKRLLTCGLFLAFMTLGNCNNAINTEKEQVLNLQKERISGMTGKIAKTEEEWRAQLTPQQYKITRQKGTEPAFTGNYLNNKKKGLYGCVCCKQELFSSDKKYDSGCGWPSFWAPVSEESVTNNRDGSYGVSGTEVLCSRCDAHLGHLFNDGPPPTGLRY